jgi:hypothetical protein
MLRPAGPETRLPGTEKGEAAPAPSSAQPDETSTRIEAMRAKIKAGGHDSPYRLRKQLPEPVFGQIKQARGFRQFLLRNFEKVRAEWALVCTPTIFSSSPTVGFCPQHCNRPSRRAEQAKTGVTNTSRPNKLNRKPPLRSPATTIRTGS